MNPLEHRKPRYLEKQLKKNDLLAELKEKDVDAYNLKIHGNEDLKLLMDDLNKQKHQSGPQRLTQNRSRP